MDIRSSLPLLEGWRWETRDVDYAKFPIEILPGKDFTIASHIVRAGWITNILLWLDNQFTSLRLAYDGVREEVSADDLYEQGAIQPQNINFWLARYDKTSSPPVFVIKFTPSEAVPFVKDISAHLTNPSVKPDGTANTTAHLYRHKLTTIEIVNRDKFIKSVHELYPKWPEWPPVQPPVPPPVQPPPRLPPEPPPAPPPDELGTPEALPPWRRV